MKILMFVLLCLEFSAFAATEVKEFDSSSIKKIIVENISGAIKINGSNVQKTVVSVDKVKFDSQCELDIKQDEDELLVKVQRDNVNGSGDCQTDVTIQASKEVALKVSNGVGNLEITGTKGKLDYQVGRGDVKVNAEVSDLEGKLGSGATDVRGMAGSAKLRTGTGDIQLRYSRMPSAGEIDIKAGSSDATLFLPPDLKIMTTVVQGKGGVTNDMGEDLNAKFKVSYKSGSGDLTIRKVPNQSF